MAKLEYRKLSDGEVQAALAELSGWSVDGGQLCKTFPFRAYMDAFGFAFKIGNEAEQLNHHPDILIGYEKVTVRVNTHDVGGLSPYDFELARLIDLI